MPDDTKARATDAHRRVAKKIVAYFRNNLSFNQASADALTKHVTALLADIPGGLVLTDEDARDLNQAMEMLEGASSGFIPLCGEDEKWCARRDRSLADCRAIITRATTPGGEWQEIAVKAIQEQIDNQRNIVKSISDRHEKQIEAARIVGMGDAIIAIRMLSPKQQGGQ